MADPGKMTAAATAVLNKIALRDPALANKIRADVASGNRDQWVIDADQAVNVKKYVTAAEGKTLIQGTTFGGKSAGGGAINAGPKAAADAAGDAITSLNPLAGLFQANIWIRVAEVGIGVLLVAVGVAKLTNAVGIATKISGAVSKMPIPV